MPSQSPLAPTTPSAGALLGEVLLRLAELAVVVGGGALLVTTQALDVAGMVGLFLLCATWAVIGSVVGALQLEGPRFRKRSLAPGKLVERRLRAGAGGLSFPVPPPHRGQLSLPLPEGSLSFEPAPRFEDLDEARPRSPQCTGPAVHSGKPAA